MATNSAPSQLTPIQVDLAIGTLHEDGQIYATMYFAQMIQRILSFIGQPASGSSPNKTLTEQINSVQQIATSGALGADALAMEGRVSRLERIFGLLSGSRASLPAPRAATEPLIPQTIPPAGLTAHVSWVAGQNPANVPIFTAQKPCQISAVIGRLEIAQGAAATLSVVLAPSGTAISAGTAVHSGSFNANGTAATNQTLTLATAATALKLNAGDSLGIQTTGTWTTSVGGITIFISAQ